MGGETAGGLTQALEGDRESCLRRALAALRPGEARELECRGLSAHRFLSAFVGCVLAGQGGDGGEARSELREVAALCVEAGVDWTVLAGLCEALGESVIEHLGGRDERAGLGAVYRELLAAQSLLFSTFLEAEGRRRERLERCQRDIDRFPDTIAATLDPPTLTKVGLGRIKDLVGVDECTLLVLDASRRLYPLAGDLAFRSPEAWPLTLDGAAAGALLEKGESYWEEPGRERPCLEGLREKAGIASALLLPLVVRGRTTGIILLSDGPRIRRFGPDEIRLAERFAGRLAVALENAHLHSREQRKIRETVALLEITRAINSTLDLREILEKVVRMTVDLCGGVLCVVYLVREEGGRFYPAAHYGFLEDALWEEHRVAGFGPSDLGWDLVATLERGRPVSLPSARASFLVPSGVMYEHGVDLVFIFPLCGRNRLTGAFSLFFSHREGEELEMEEVEVIGAIAAQASMAIENAALYEDIERSYFSTVQALAKAIEVKDPYTHGHSERVTEYALMIAREMELDEREKQKLKYAATLHDIGKIGIAGRVLNKPGALTEEEYSHVKTHPLLGDSIIEPVEFLQGPRPIILHHHERYDGKGYPGGLKGTDIPLCARILSVADAFEAMRSDRPYRLALPLEEAKEELRRNAGTQFDPEVVEIFLSILERCDRDPVNTE